MMISATGFLASRGEILCRFDDWRTAVTLYRSLGDVDVGFTVLVQRSCRCIFGGKLTAAMQRAQQALSR
jgi:hypothetical protein